MAFCKNCGAELGEGVQFCANCGTPAAPEQPVQQVQPVQPEVQYVQPQQIEYAQPQQAAPVQTPQNNQAARTILIMGIIALAVSWMPVGSIAGIILGAIGMGKSNAYVAAGGVRCGMSITGRILARVGMIVGIVMTVVWAIYFIAIGAAFSSVRYYY